MFTNDLAIQYYTLPLLSCLSRTSSLGRINMNKQLCEPVMEPNVTKRMNEPYSWVDAKEILIER